LPKVATGGSQGGEEIKFDRHLQCRCLLIARGLFRKCSGETTITRCSQK
jgi:hypothetical protein